MINTTRVIIDTNNIFKILKLEFFNNNKIFKINLIICVFSYQFLGYQIFIKDGAFDLLNFWFGIIFCFTYYIASWLIIKITLTEFGFLKKKIEKGSLSIIALLLKTNNKYSKKTRADLIEEKVLEIDKKQGDFIKKNEFEAKIEIVNENTNEIVILSKKTLNNNESIKSVKDKLIKGNKNYTDFIKNQFEPIKNIANKNTSEIETLNKKTSNNSKSIMSHEDNLIKANKNHIDFVKNEFESTKNLLNNTTKRTTIIENQIFIKEKIKTYCSQEDIKSIFMQNKKDLFENLDVHSFMKYMFEGSNKLGVSNLFYEEKNNILAIMTLLIEKEKIDGNNSVLFRLAKPYLKLDIKLRMFGINIKNRKYSLTNDRTKNHILKKITNFKNI